MLKTKSNGIQALTFLESQRNTQFFCVRFVGNDVDHLNNKACLHFTYSKYKSTKIDSTTCYGHSIEIAGYLVSGEWTLSTKYVTHPTRTPQVQSRC